VSLRATSMPFKSKAPRRKFAELLVKGEISTRSPRTSAARSACGSSPRAPPDLSSAAGQRQQRRRHRLPLQQPHAFQALGQLRRPCGDVGRRVIHPLGPRLTLGKLYRVRRRRLAPYDPLESQIPPSLAKLVCERASPPRGPDISYAQRSDGALAMQTVLRFANGRGFCLFG
jgi:hypothetical protein